MHLEAQLKRTQMSITQHWRIYIRIEVRKVNCYLLSFFVKPACFVALEHGWELEDIPDDLRNRGKGFHSHYT